MLSSFPHKKSLFFKCVAAVIRETGKRKKKGKSLLSWHLFYNFIPLPICWSPLTSYGQNNHSGSSWCSDVCYLDIMLPWAWVAHAGNLSFRHGCGNWTLNSLE